MIQNISACGDRHQPNLQVRDCGHNITKARYVAERIRNHLGLVSTIVRLASLWQPIGQAMDEDAATSGRGRIVE